MESSSLLQGFFIINSEIFIAIALVRAIFIAIALARGCFCGFFDAGTNLLILYVRPGLTLNCRSLLVKKLTSGER